MSHVIGISDDEKIKIDAAAYTTLVNIFESRSANGVKMSLNCIKKIPFDFFGKHRNALDFELCCSKLKKKKNKKNRNRNE